MKVDFLKPQTAINPDCVEYGDVIITDRGAFLIVTDFDSRDYVGVNLLENYISCSSSTVSELLEEELGGCIIKKLIKKDELILGVK